MASGVQYQREKETNMIKTRLVGLLSHAKKYIVYTILWQWLALLSPVIAVFSIAASDLNDQNKEQGEDIYETQCT